MKKRNHESITISDDGISVRASQRRHILSYVSDNMKF